MCSFNTIENFLDSSFAASLLGAIIGACGSWYGAKLSNRANEKNRKIESCKRRVREFTAIKCELDYLLERYFNVYGSEIINTEDGQPIEEFSVSKEGYFVVFSNNSSCVGDIKSKNTQEGIIKSYILARAIMEEFDINNKMIKKIETKKEFLKENALKIEANEEKNIRFNLKQDERSLVAYAQVIKKDNHTLIECAHIAISGLEKEIQEVEQELEILLHS